MRGIHLVGIGPGDISHLSREALWAISSSSVIVGYKNYFKLIPGLIRGKELIATGMTKEVERARAAIERALSGKVVAVVSSGDPGIYGMAGLVLEMLGRLGVKVKRLQDGDPDPRIHLLGL